MSLRALALDWSVDGSLGGAFLVLMLAYGHDEEINGVRGATSLLKAFQDRKLRFEFVLDEGSAIAQGLLPGIDKPVALVGLAEKGYASVVLRATGASGHSSLPPPVGTGPIGVRRGSIWSSSSAPRWDVPARSPRSWWLRSSQRPPRMRG